MGIRYSFLECFQLAEGGSMHALVLNKTLSRRMDTRIGVRCFSVVDAFFLFKTVHARTSHNPLVSAERNGHDRYKNVGIIQPSGTWTHEGITNASRFTHYYRSTARWTLRPHTRNTIFSVDFHITLVIQRTFECTWQLCRAVRQADSMVSE